MKKILVLLSLILVSSGCTKVQKNQIVAEQQQCPSCEEYCKEHPVVKEPEIPEPAKHPIDIEEEKCIKIADTSDIGMGNCALKATEDWFKEIDKNLMTLKQMLPAEKYEKIADSQKKWESYIKSEFDVNENVIFYKTGTIYYTISAGQKAYIVKERALLLKSYIQYANEP